MPTTYHDQQVFNLREVMSSIQKTLARRYTASYWMRAEMNKLNHYAYSGHCYPDLVEKESGKVVAQARAIIWKADYRRIDAHFRQVLKEPLREGSHILFRAEIQFTPVYGLSLRIVDIDPTFSLGELEREKHENIARLKKEGIFNLNQSKVLPPLPKRLAIISVETSKGYADFVKIIEENDEGFRFFHHLFPAKLQGEQAVTTIIGQLERIRKVATHFDAVVIVRGGGGEVGLTAFNDYNLARTIACYPLPVLTGIGHATNETIAERVSFRNAITPTEVANILLQKFRRFESALQEAEQKIGQIARQKLHFENHSLTRLQQSLIRETHRFMRASQQQLVTWRGRFQQQVRYRIQVHRTEIKDARLLLPSRAAAVLARQKDSLTLLQVKRNLLDPVQVLKRGFSITRQHNRILAGIEKVDPEAPIETQLWNGTLHSTLQQIEKKDSENPDKS